MGQTLVLVLTSALVNIIYFVCGLVDARVSAIARKRHAAGARAVWIDAARMAVLVGLQIVFYMAVNLGQYSPYVRLTFHAVSISCLFLGTRMSVIGLTGGIACGKSSVVDMLKNLNFKVIDCDKIAHELYDDAGFCNKLFNAFGKEAILAEDGKSVDRTKLGAIVFADSAKRKKLNSLTSGPIFYGIIRQVFKLRVLQGHPLVVIDAPILFETKVLEYLCYPIVVVKVKDSKMQLDRLM